MSMHREDYFSASERFRFRVCDLLEAHGGLFWATIVFAFLGLWATFRTVFL